MDEGVPIQVALGKVIRAMGVKEFAGKVRMASPNVLRAIHPRHNPTQDTLNRLAEAVPSQAEPGSTGYASKQACSLTPSPSNAPNAHSDAAGPAGAQPSGPSHPGHTE